MEDLFDLTPSSLGEKSLTTRAFVENKISHNNLTSQLHETVLSAGADKRMAKRLKRKI